MLDLLLNESYFLAALIAGAVLTPIAAIIIARAKPALRGRLLFACGAFGPAALIFWGWHNLVLAVLGFDSVASLLVVLVSGALLGLGAGVWIRRGGVKLMENESEGPAE